MDKIINLTSVNKKCEENNEVVKDSLLVKFLKLFNKRNFKLILLVCIGLVLLLFCFCFDKKDNKTDVVKTNSSNYISTMEYSKLLEEKLVNVLSAVDGAGKVSVMLSLDGSPELVYAKDTDETLSSNSNGVTSSSTSSSPIIVEVNGTNNALVLTEILPAVKGVIVVSSGAGNVAVKLNLLNAVTTLLNITTDQVTVLKGI